MLTEWYYLGSFFFCDVFVTLLATINVPYSSKRLKFFSLLMLVCFFGALAGTHFIGYAIEVAKLSSKLRVMLVPPTFRHHSVPTSFINICSFVCNSNAYSYRLVVKFVYVRVSMPYYYSEHSYMLL